MSQQLFVEFDRAALQIAPERIAPKVKKIPIELRKPKLAPPQGSSWAQSIRWRLKHDSQFLRSSVQLTFVLLCLWIGIEFYLFMRWGISGGQAAFNTRPPGAEGFLPISALMSLKFWFDTGIVNQVHPSGLFILVAIIAMSIGLKKAFCSWLCPIGTLSESLWMLGQEIFGRTFTITKWIDIPLRSLKYLLLLFFAFAIWRMDVPTMRAFIESPYNKMADVKMYLFFASITSTALWTILVLIGLSIVVKNFWCRYLCPYGALLGFLSILSPLKITRQKSTCIDCDLCTRECPSGIKVHSANRVWSDECTACLKCVQVCPVKNTLEIRTSKGAKPIPSLVFGGLVVGVFVAVTGLAMLTNSWQNSITRQEYLQRFEQLETPEYSHPFSGSGNYGPN